MKDLQSVFDSQRTFFDSQKTKDISFRKETLRRLKILIQSNEKRLYEAIYKDFGKSAFDTYTTELSIIYAEIDYFLKSTGRLSKPKRVRNNLANLPGKSYVQSEPLGTVLVIGAWNYPYQLTLVPVISAVAAGNTCMIKPSELPVHTMDIMAELINEHFSAEYLYVVKGGVPETSEILRFAFDKIFFTGSTKVGKIVYEAAARNLTPVTLELGGKSPVIVTKSANLKVAARRIVWGKFLNAGQTCIAPDYLLVDVSVKDELMGLIRERLDRTLYSHDATHYVRIINKRNFDRLAALIDPKKLYYGGKADESRFYIGPSLLDNVSWDDPVMQEEIFGPILPILSYTDLNEVFYQIRQHDKPLAAYLFSGDRGEKEQFLHELSFGGGCINDTVMHISNARLPFGGVGSSGMGSYHGVWGFKAFSHQKSILERALWGEPDLKYPPYTDQKLYWIKKLV